MEGKNNQGEGKARGRQGVGEEKKGGDVTEGNGRKGCKAESQPLIGVTYSRAVNVQPSIFA